MDPMTAFLTMQHGFSAPSAPAPEVVPLWAEAMIARLDLIAKSTSTTAGAPRPVVA